MPLTRKRLLEVEQNKTLVEKKKDDYEKKTRKQLTLYLKFLKIVG